MATNLLSLSQISQNPTLVTRSILLEKSTGPETILFRPLLHQDIDALQKFLESLSESTRRFATYPSYDLECAQEFCDEIDENSTLRMIAITVDGRMIALFEFNFDFVEFDIKRYRTYGVELDPEHDVQFAPCITDEYQHQRLGTKLLRLMIDLAKRLGKTRMIAWAGVLIDNEQAIRFYEKNSFQIFREKYTAEDGYECYDGILQLT